MSILVFLAAVFQDEPPKPTLPPVARVTVKLDRVPAPTALREFEAASGLRVRYQARWRSESGLDDRPVSLELNDAPFVEAIGKFCRAHGELYFSFDDAGAVVVDGADLSPICASGLFGFAVVDLDESVSTDFAEETRRLMIDVTTWWQPDLKVFSLVGVSIDEAVDDIGTDLRLDGVKHRLDQLHKADLTLALPPRTASSISRLRGSMEFEVPGDVVEVSLTDLAAESIGPIKTGNCVIKGTRYDSEEGTNWAISLEPDEKPALLGVTEARVIRTDGKQPESGQWACADAKKIWFQSPSDADVKALTFKIVKSKARLKIPFEFKDIKLPRTK